MNELRKHKSYVAFVGHRVSGLALALFLPFHFLLLGSALKGSAGLDSALALVDNPLFKVAEWGLVVLLAAHLLFGMRILLLEFSTWPGTSENLTGWIVPVIVASFFVGIVFLVQSGS